LAGRKLNSREIQRTAFAVLILLPHVKRTITPSILSTIDGAFYNGILKINISKYLELSFANLKED
jgi:hypothetical protein